MLLKDFAVNAEDRMDAIAAGRNPDDLQATSSSPSGFAIGLAAAKLAIMRVIRRFFSPYDPAHV